MITIIHPKERKGKHFDGHPMNRPPIEGKYIFYDNPLCVGNIQTDEIVRFEVEVLIISPSSELLINWLEQIKNEVEDF